jgi:hypothetical protein
VKLLARVSLSAAKAKLALEAIATAKAKVFTVLKFIKYFFV